MKHLLVLVACALAPGCFLSREYVNASLDAEALATLEPGTTTAREVVERLGAPNEVVQLGRRSAYRYEHGQVKQAGALFLVVGLLNQDTQVDRAWVFFDEDDVLTHVGTSLRADEAEYAMPWVAHD